MSTRNDDRSGDNAKSRRGRRTRDHGSSSRHSGRGNRSRRGRRNRRRRQQIPPDGVQFWGDPARLPSVGTDVRMTAEPTAVAKSLGPPPLPGHEQVAGHYFEAVYHRAVTTAGAVAAAGGLIDPDALADELEQ
jgi:hypothetical protein